MTRVLPAIVGGLVLVTAATLFILGRGNFTVQALGILLVPLAPLVAQKMRQSRAGQSSTNPYAVLYSLRYKNFLRSWPMGTAIVAAFAASFWLLHIDALSGGDHLFPVLFFAGSAMAVLGYLVYLTAPRPD